MNSPNPLISVVLSLHDDTRRGVAAVQSVFNQSWRPLELIIVAGDATAASAAEIKAVIAHAPQDVTVQMIAGQNDGAAQSINAGLRAAGGEYIALLDAGDTYAPDRLARCHAASAGAGVVITHIAPVDDNGHPLEPGESWRTHYDRTLVQDIGVFPGLSCLSVFVDIVVTSSNLFIRRDVLATAGEFADFPRLHYLDFFLRAALLAEPLLLREKLLFHHVRAGPAANDPAHATAEHAAVVRKHLVRLMSGAPPANPLADVFAAHPFVLAQCIWPDVLQRAFDGLLEYRDAPDQPAAAGVCHVPAPRTGAACEFTLVTHELTLTGAPVLVLELATLLRERGCAVAVLSLIDGPLRPEFVRRGIRVVTPPILLDRIARMQVKTGLWATRENRPPERILHLLATSVMAFAEWLWQLRLWSLARGIFVLNSVASWPLAVRLRGTQNAPVFWYVHESVDAQWIIAGGRANAKLQRLAADGRLKMIFGSAATRLHWAANGYPGQVRYWSGISTHAGNLYIEPGQRELRAKRDRRVILNVGSVSGRKGTRSLVEAFALGRAEGLIPADVELCIVGCPPPSVNPEARDLVRRIFQPDLHGHVRVVHNVNPAALRSYYHEADVYVQASIFDCMPIALLTAMAHGLPIVTTDADGCKEAIVHESCGLLVPPRQPRQMAEALGRLFAEPAAARAFGAAARARFVERFAVEATFEPLYATLAGDTSAT